MGSGLRGHIRAPGGRDRGFSSRGSVAPGDPDHDPVRSACRSGWRSGAPPLGRGDDVRIDLVRLGRARRVDKEIRRIPPAAPPQRPRGRNRGAHRPLDDRSRVPAASVEGERPVGQLAPDCFAHRRLGLVLELGQCLARRPDCERERLPKVLKPRVVDADL